MSEKTKNIKKVRQFLADKKEEDKITKIWNSTGLIPNLDGEDKTTLAMLFESISKFLLSINVSDEIGLVTIPIAGRCFIYLNYTIKDIPKYIEYLEKRFSQTDEQKRAEIKVFYRTTGDTNDVQADMCVIVSTEVKELEL